MSNELLKLERVLELTGKARSTHYLDIRNGEMVQPVKIGRRAAAYPEHEVDQIVVVRSLGATSEQVRELVKRLASDRKKALEAILSNVNVDHKGCKDWHAPNEYWEKVLNAKDPEREALFADFEAMISNEKDVGSSGTGRMGDFGQNSDHKNRMVFMCFKEAVVYFTWNRLTEEERTRLDDNNRPNTNTWKKPAPGEDTQLTVVDIISIGPIAPITYVHAALKWFVSSGAGSVDESVCVLSRGFDRSETYPLNNLDDWKLNPDGYSSNDEEPELVYPAVFNPS